MGILDTNYQDQRLTASQKKKIKPAIQGGGYNYLGEQEEVTVPKKWLSDPDHVVAELAYITPREKKVLIDLNMYGSLDGKPNNAPGGLPSLQGDMGSIGGGGRSSGGGGGSSGGSGGGGGGGGSGGGGRQDAESQYGGSPYDSSQNVSERGTGFTYGANSPTVPTPVISTTPVAPPSILSPPPDTREQYSTETQYQTTPQALGLVDAEDEYLAPDPEHFNKTQREINKKINEAKQEGNYDVKLTKEQYEQFNKDLNEYYGTEDVKYEPYGRAGEGTVNLTFGEHWQNLGMQYPDLKLSPTARFLGALGRNVNEYLTSDYGTGQYGGAGTMGSSYAVDRGGLLGRLGMTSGTGGQDVMIDTGGDATTTTQPTTTAPTTTLPPSMVNQYFANMGDMGNALSSQLQTDYNNAKNSINSILGITPPSQQFGYSADPYGGLMASNLTTNPYNIDYLRRLGLI